MIIPITDKYRLKSDSRQWMIQKLEWVTDKKTKEKRRDFVSFNYYADINQAVNGLAQLMIRASEAQTLADALAEVDNGCVTLTQALSPVFEVKQR